jgi:putative peptide maturation dehydrogenase
MRIRRRRACVVQVSDRSEPDVARLLAGEMIWVESTVAELICPFSPRPIALEPDAVALLSQVSGDAYVAAEDLAARTGASLERIALLVEAGVLVGEGSALDADDARLDRLGWHPFAAAYHAATRWSGVEGDETKREHTDAAHRERLTAHAVMHGEVPPHFSRRDDAIARVELPLPPFDDAFARVLKSRRTTRHFDTEARLPLDAFNRVLFGAYGAQGTKELAPGIVAVKRTSASGGSLHPIDAYPLVIRVEGLRTGLYHYDAGEHALNLLREMDEPDARRFATDASIGQAYFAEAHACVLQVARFDRNQWKYRRHAKAYKAVLLDAGHLSQTFYLLAAERGLGAFYTAAINDADLAVSLGLDPLASAAIGMHGVGIVDSTRNQLHFLPEPYLPSR